MKQMTMTNCVDTNILLYAIDEEVSSRDKRLRALDILKGKPFISGQTLSEFINVCRKRWKKDKRYIIGITEIFLEQTILIPIDVSIAHKAFRLVDKYRFQIFDSLIVASALEATCEILYSEDMQHEPLIENQLKIINPFV
jgi:predicted nucleic acid-binding protein